VSLDAVASYTDSDSERAALLMPATAATVCRPKPRAAPHAYFTAPRQMRADLPQIETDLPQSES
jgi:hypothetical protein